MTPSDNARCTRALDPQGTFLHTPGRISSASIRQGSPCTVPLWKDGVFFARFGSLASISFRAPLHFAGFRDALRFGARPRTCVCHCARAGTRHSLGPPTSGLHPAVPSLLGWFPSHKLASCGAVGSSLPLSHTRSLLFAPPQLVFDSPVMPNTPVDVQTPDRTWKPGSRSADRTFAQRELASSSGLDTMRDFAQHDSHCVMKEHHDSRSTHHFPSPPLRHLAHRPWVR